MVKTRAAAQAATKAEVAKATKAKLADRAEQAPDSSRVTDALRLPQGPVDLGLVDARGTPGFDGKKPDAERERADLAGRLGDLQERLFAEGRTGGTRSLLLVLQGMDTSGKGGTVRHVIGQMDPQGCAIRSFRAPTEQERKHDFLWRIKRALPAPGLVGVFDRSHYEDVVVVRVHDLAPEATWSRRYEAINRFESQLVGSGTVVVKCFLHISRGVSRDRLLARLDDPTKRWKYRPGDVDERARWDDYMAAYGDALARCNTDVAPWHLVPADRKWYRNWAITHLLVERFEAMALTWPVADFDVEAERERVLASP